MNHRQETYSIIAMSAYGIGQTALLLLALVIQVGEYGEHLDNVFHWILSIPIIIIMMVSYTMVIFLNAITAPISCIFMVEIASILWDKGQCSLSTYIGIINYISLGSFFSILFYGFLIAPDDRGVPKLIRFLAFFTRDAQRLSRDVERSAGSPDSPRFDPTNLSRMADRQSKSRYSEILDREEINRATQQADRALAKLSKREAELRRHQADKVKAAEELARKAEEYEKAKARLAELERRKKD